MINLIFPS